MALASIRTFVWSGRAMSERERGWMNNLPPKRKRQSGSLELVSRFACALLLVGDSMPRCMHRIHHTATTSLSVLMEPLTNAR